MNKHSRTRPQGLVVAAILGCALLTTGIAAYLFGWITPIDQARGVRRVLRGEPTTGNAWTQYQRALDFFDDGAATGEVLAAIRRGAQCERADGPSHILEDGTVSVHGHDVLSISKMLEALSQHVVAGAPNDPAGAGAALMDCAMMARDLTELGEMVEQLVGLILLDRVLLTLASECQLASWSGSQLEALAGELLVLERGLPDFGLQYENQVLFAITALRGTPEQLRTAGLEDRLHRRNCWERLFGASIAGATIQRIRTAMERLSAATTKPWPQALTALKTSCAELAASHDPITAALCPAPSFEDFARPRRVIAQLRMLRQLVCVLAHDDDLQLDNPFGGVFDTCAGDDQLDVSGLGPDGRTIEVVVPW